VAKTYSTRNYQPIRKLVAFALVIVLLYGLMALTKSWAPQLGLDLRGGTTVTLTARQSDLASNAPKGPMSTNTTGATPTPTDTVSPTTPTSPGDSVAPTATATPPASPSTTESTSPTDTTSPGSTPGTTPTGGNTTSNWSMADAMEQARLIIQQRVDSLGVGEASVTLQGSQQIQIAVPNIAGDDLLNLVGKTASLQFRNVYQAAAATPPASATPTDSGTPAASPTPTDSASIEPGPTPTSTAPASTASGRPAPALPTAPPAPRPTAPTTDPYTVNLNDLLNWTPSATDQSDFDQWNCGDYFPDVWDQPLFACSPDGTAKYLLGPVIISGDHIVAANAAMPQGQLTWEVDLAFDAIGTKQFALATAYLYNQYITNPNAPTDQFAIVLDQQVMSAPAVNKGAIETGNASISGGNINQDSAQNLARVLRYGALPLAFDVSTVDTVSPSLGGEQLRAGIIAGIIGLILVLAYSAIYYRALFVIVVGSLASAALITYATVVLLGQTISFALSLPGIAGIIMAIGVTADSFIVYFERIRDDVREGYSLQHAVESGWTKARGTIVIADSVQLLSAAVLFVLSIGSVKGFAFTLFVTTAIDLFIVFFFSKPLMTLLARMDFYASGHPMSGFDPAHLGVSPEVLRGRRAVRSATSAAASISKEA